MSAQPKAPPVYRPHQSANPGVQLKPANNFRTETRPAPLVYRPQQQNPKPHVQLKPANDFRTDVRPGPPVYRPQQVANQGAQLKPTRNFRMETRPAPPVYGPQRPANLGAQIEASGKLIMELRPAQPVYRLQRSGIPALQPKAVIQSRLCYACLPPSPFSLSLPSAERKYARNSFYESHVVQRSEIEEEEEVLVGIAAFKQQMEERGFTVYQMNYEKKDFFVWKSDIGDKDSDHIHVFFKKVPDEGEDHLLQANNMEYCVTCKGPKGSRATHVSVEATGLDSGIFVEKLLKEGTSEGSLDQETALIWGIGNLDPLKKGKQGLARTFSNKRAYAMFADWVDKMKGVLSDL